MGVTIRGALGVRRWALAGALAGGCVASAACAIHSPDEVRRPTVSLRMRGSPPDAAVLIDEEAIGQLDFVAAHGVALPPGVHHVTVKANGYFPWDREVEAKEGSPPIELQVTLTPVPD